MNAERYCTEVLTPSPYAKQLVNTPRRLFQQDRASIHTAQFTTQFLTEQQVPVMDWPTRSPDLNPLENLWAAMARLMRRTGPTTTAELK